MPRVRPRLVALLLLLVSPVTGWAQPAPSQDGIAVVLQRMEKSLLDGHVDGYLALVAPGANAEAAYAFAKPLFVPGITKATLRERDRQPLQGTVSGEGYRLLVEALLERGRSGRIVTWRLDLRRAREDETRWFISGQEQVSSLDGLYQLRLDASRQFAARDLTITSIDFSLSLPKGRAYVAETDAGVTALVLFGKGTMRFSPAPAAERRQVQIYGGEETLVSPFNAALVRLNPAEYADRVSSGALTADEQVDTDSVRAAQSFFDVQIGQSFAIATDLSPRANWSLTPAFGDFLADVRTKQGTLTFARSSSEAEDITVFDRRRRKNISLYASPQKLETRGRFYNEDDLADYDVLSYDVDATFTPEHQAIDGETTITLKVRAPSLATLTLRLADSLNVQSILSPQLGRLLFFRVVGQNSIIVSLPAMVFKDQQFSLAVSYSGRLEPQELDREAVSVGEERQEFASDFPSAQPEPRYIYSNRAYWYPQGQVTDYATATMRISVPEELGCVGSGDLVDVRTVTVETDRGDVRRRQFTFEARQPLRYLACVISRFVSPHTMDVKLTAGSADSSARSARAGGAVPGPEGVLRLAVASNPRQDSRGRSFQDRAAGIIQFYSALAGDTPYPSFTLAVTESDLPGGHSPAYFAVLNQPTGLSGVTWRNDPVSFEGFPSFFLAHEVAHQWWGQAVGWKNYHEQWISEGFAQYFAALYARQERGDDGFTTVLRQMRRWAMTYSDQGPIALGYRLGHIKSDSRVFRAIIYNKSAVVLDMLRRLVGDASFFRGVRRFYLESRFKKVGTDEARKAFEAESGEELDRFFEGWIMSADLPVVRVDRQIITSDTDAPALKLVFEQQQPELFDLVIPVAVRYTSGSADIQEVRVRERRTEVTVPLKGQLKSVDPDPEKVTLCQFR